MPHVQVHILDADNPQFQSLLPARKPREKKLPGTDEMADVSWAKLHLAQNQPENAADDMDAQAPPELVDAARRLLLAYGSNWNPEAVRAWCAEESARFQAELVERFGRRGIDWSLGDADFQKAKLEAKLLLSDREGKIRAGEPLAGVLKLHNLGTSPVYRISIRVQAGPDATPGNTWLAAWIPANTAQLPFPSSSERASAGRMARFGKIFMFGSPRIHP
jgi:hypothetical protein